MKYRANGRDRRVREGIGVVALMLHGRLQLIVCNAGSDISIISIIISGNIRISNRVSTLCSLSFGLSVSISISIGIIINDSVSTSISIGIFISISIRFREQY